MSKPTGTPPPSYPPSGSYNLPPLPPSPDETDGRASDPSGQQAQQSAVGSRQDKSGQAETRKQHARQPAPGKPQMRQDTETGSSASTRTRGKSMTGRMPDTWSAGSSAASGAAQGSANTGASATTTTSLQSSGSPTVKPRTGAAHATPTRPNLGRARIASTPVSPMPLQTAGGTPSQAKASPASSSSGKPPADTPPPLPQVPRPSDVPPPKLPHSSKVPALPLPTLAPAPAAPTALITPASEGTVKKSGAMNGEDVKPELRVFIDGVLDGSIGVDHEKYAEQLGELLVHVESHGGVNPVSESTHKTVMRAGLRIRGYTPTSGGKSQEVNVISQFSQPFVKAMLWSGESERVRQKLMQAYDKVAGAINSLSKKGAELTISEVTTHPEFLRLMKPVEDMFIDYVCGPRKTLASSHLPDPIKQLLQSMDKHLIVWFENCGTDKPKDLLALRTNALIGYLSTRSVTAVWRDHCHHELGEEVATKKYKQLFAYLNKIASFKFEDLVMDIVSNQKAQPKDAFNYVQALRSPRQLIQKKNAAEVPTVSTNSVLRRGKTLNASSQLKSPRSDGTDAKASARAREAERNLKKEQMQHKLARAHFAEQIIEEANLRYLDSRFAQHMKEKIVDMSRRGFDNFRRDPIPYCQSYATAFYGYGDNVKNAGKDAPASVQRSLAALQDSYRISNHTKSDSDTDSIEEATVTLTSAAIRTTTTTATTATTGEGTGNSEEESDGSIIVGTPSSSNGDSSS